MSEWGKVPREVFLDDRLTRRDLRVLVILCTHADGRTGICTRKQEAIADEIGSDRSGVNRSIARLVSLGYVSTARDAGLRRALRYAVHVPCDIPTRRRDPSAQKVPVKQGLRMRVFERDGFKCQRCGAQADLHADHVIPSSIGGPTSLSNLQTLCRSCNLKKGVKLDEVRA